MRESFVFHADFIDHLPDELKTEWAMFCINYGLYEIEPKFDDVLHAELWRKLKDRMDSDSDSYEIKKQNQKIWRAKNHVKEGRATEEELALLGSLGTPKNSQNSQKLPLDTRYEYESDSVSVSEYEFDSEYEFEYESEYVSDAKKGAPSSLSPSQTEYSKQIFTIFKDAGLPCSNKNELSFLQTDFKNAISFIHKSDDLKNFSSKDIISACKNYVILLNDSQTYYKQKHNFYSLVKSKIFYNLLPGNFDINSFKKFETKAVAGENTETEEKKVYSSKPCPSCNTNKVYWSQKSGCYVCDSCAKHFDFDEYLGEI